MAAKSAALVEPAALVKAMELADGLCDPEVRRIGVAAARCRRRTGLS